MMENKIFNKSFLPNGNVSMILQVLLVFLYPEDSYKDNYKP